MELSIVMPCLNEADTIAACVGKALRSLAALGVEGEVIVADNGSTDGSPELAAAAGARVVPVSARGYGSALMGGIEAARGRFILMGDADDSYDFAAIEPFLAKLRDGWELVQGCRLPGGGGRVLPGAMPPLHRWVGNPLFTALARWWFGSPVHDTNCGLRAFTKDLYRRLDQRCTGMEFANEMLIKASLAQARIAEVPITLHPDGRKAHRPHLRTFRDGWRTLRFYLLYCPRWLFLVPGLGLMVLGLAGYALAWQARPGTVLIVLASLLLLCGYQSVLFAFLTKAFAINEGLLPMNRRMAAFFRVMTLERGLVAGALALLLGVAGLAVAWLDLPGNAGVVPGEMLKLAIPAATLATLGFQTVLFSFFASLLGMHRR
jgi:glycosyltransferase involved in cell wall biosynthesis